MLLFVLDAFVRRSRLARIIIWAAPRDRALSHVRLVIYSAVLDSLSLFQTVRTNYNTNKQLVVKLLTPINEAIKLSHVKIHVFWVSSHCGLRSNDRGDEQAKRGQKLFPELQLEIPIEYADTKIWLTERRKIVQIPLPDTPETIAVTFSPRRIATLLNQLLTGIWPSFYPLSRILKLDNGKCETCDCNNTVTHVLRCRTRGQTKRSSFTGIMSKKDRILQQPTEVQEYCRREKILSVKDSILGRKGTKASGFSQKRKKKGYHITLSKEERVSCCKLSTSLVQM